MAHCEKNKWYYQHILYKHCWLWQDEEKLSSKCKAPRAEFQSKEKWLTERLMWNILLICKPRHNNSCHCDAMTTLMPHQNVPVVYFLVNFKQTFEMSIIFFFFAWNCSELFKGQSSKIKSEGESKSQIQTNWTGLDFLWLLGKFYNLKDLNK